ncbi:uncharacterized protein BDZ99DRAFT_522570 [Mytilinidion resinicola]|uniref:Uncharacterized protein n=1 Tax=Mytilinidion resinicola TaxID=574789 RepID=A0A6A6YJ66_9PEZI|nr:uncharacterized protein BDZ99DRAFT_522570 [Mytilinidion resinicola]KAF2807967.1 hypothetical protein BDZ99DRAFT_522570 [Mytilinidion resinicola]
MPVLAMWAWNYACVQSLVALGDALWAAAMGSAWFGGAYCSAAAPSGAARCWHVYSAPPYAAASHVPAPAVYCGPGQGVMSALTLIFFGRAISKPQTPQLRAPFPPDHRCASGPYRPASLTAQARPTAPAPETRSPLIEHPRALCLQLADHRCPCLRPCARDCTRTPGLAAACRPPSSPTLPRTFQTQLLLRDDSPPRNPSSLRRLCPQPSPPAVQTLTVHRSGRNAAVSPATVIAVVLSQPNHPPPATTTHTAPIAQASRLPWPALQSLQPGIPIARTNPPSILRDPAKNPLKLPRANHRGAQRRSGLGIHPPAHKRRRPKLRGQQRIASPERRSASHTVAQVPDCCASFFVSSSACGTSTNCIPLYGTTTPRQTPALRKFTVPW